MGEYDRPGQAIVEISTDLLRDLLHMPATARIVQARMSPDVGRIEVLVESPDLPCDEVAIRRITPTVTHTPEQFEWSWGISLPKDRRDAL